MDNLLMSNDAEILLSTVQNLRRFLSNNPHARGDIAVVECSWLPGELFPPERTVLVQAVNVLVNAGELFVTECDDVRVYSAEAPLDRVSGYY